MNEIEKGLVIGLLIIMAIETIRCNWRVSKLIDQMNHNFEIQGEYDKNIYDVLREVAPEQSNNLRLVEYERVDLGSTK